ncbi:hypothetical protein, partial [Flavobacterium sp. B17]|uniref:hypothetical protein n=1 Tax=Flavobacterium sp. B17 TaxID=95618 RepID=UPI0005B26F6B
MSHKLKTLIVFDTNSLRSTDGEKVVYSTFEFGKPFSILEEYITNNNLEDAVTLAIPAWAIVELKDQKERQYAEDVDNFNKHFKRLKDLPHFEGLQVNAEGFNCSDHVHEKSTAYLATKAAVKIIEL